MILVSEFHDQKGLKSRSQRGSAGLKRSCFRALRPFWSPELSNLKQQSFMRHKAWVENGKPATGPVHDAYISSHSNYRRKLRQEKRSKLQAANDKLFGSLIDKNTTRFWRTWKSLSQSKDPLPPQIDCFIDNGSIATQFADFFPGVYKNNNKRSHDCLR